MIALTLVSAALAAAQPAPMAGMDHATPAKAEAKMGCCPCPKDADKAKPAR